MFNKSRDRRKFRSPWRRCCDLFSFGEKLRLNSSGFSSVFHQILELLSDGDLRKILKQMGLCLIGRSWRFKVVESVCEIFVSNKKRVFFCLCGCLGLNFVEMMREKSLCKFVKQLSRDFRRSFDKIFFSDVQRAQRRCLKTFSTLNRQFC